MSTTKYTITNTQGNLSFDINAGAASGPQETSARSDITFYGYGRVNWGQEVDKNFYKLLENFSCEQNTLSIIPKTKTQLGGTLGINTPIIGQQWFNLTNSEMYVCINNTLPTTSAYWSHLISETYADTRYLRIANVNTSYVNLNGSNTPMTGYLTLYGAPTQDTHAATKLYVDSSVSTSAALFVRKAGDTMTSYLTLSGAPTQNLHAATKAYVDSMVGATAYVKLDGSNTPMTGYLTLYGAPTQNAHAATKLYVDSAISSLHNTITSETSVYVRKAGDNMTGLLTITGETNGTDRMTVGGFHQFGVVSAGASTKTAYYNIGSSSGNATNPYIMFYSSGSTNPAIWDSMIQASGGNSTVANKGNLTFRGTLLCDGITPTIGNQLVYKNWVDSRVMDAVYSSNATSAALYLAKTGGSMTGQLYMTSSINMNNNPIWGVKWPEDDMCAAPSGYVKWAAYGPNGTGQAHTIFIYDFDPRPSWEYGVDGDIFFQI
jgi:hypothetical protein